jgi:chorismate mutase/prephenate dehydratase
MSQTHDHVTSLDTLRARIDEIDARLHEALMERARIIDGIVAAKRASGADSVMFRPDREADMMRQLVERHEGSLPLSMIEHVWRDIISTCTLLQGSYTVHLDVSADLAEMLDLARFYFGFTVDLEPCGDAADVVGSVAASKGDLGVVALEERSELPWWRGLSDTGAQIIARLPFLMIEERPADLPALVISRAIPDSPVPDTLVFDARWNGVLPGRLMSHGIEVISFHRSASGVDALLAVSSDLDEATILAACAEAGAEPDVLRQVGGYAAPIDVEGDTEEDFASEEPAVSEG